MKNRISLNGQWLLKYVDYASGERFGLHTEQSTEGWLPAQVPGDVHLDLMAAGQITDPFYGTESDHCLWMEEKDWWYRTQFSGSDMIKTSDEQHQIFLLFHGLDTFAKIYLNGELMATHSNMFIHLKIDISGKVIPGENDLRVCLGSPAYSPDIHRDPNIARPPPQRLWSRKAQACYGWDIAPRLVTIGIWRPVEVLICDELEIRNPWIQTKRFAGSYAEVDLEFMICAHNLKTHHVVVEMELHDQTRTIEQQIDCSGKIIIENFVLENPPLWWPHNHGSPELLSYNIKLIENDQVIDSFEGRFGVRTIKLIQEPIGEERTSFYFEINNKPIFLKGMNWTPCDAIYSRINENHYRHLLEKTVKSNINALRVWGGGIYEADAFYDLCDENGILVWQDFMFACAVYPQDEEFLNEVQQEVEFIVAHLRRHPSIFVWCGDNEVDWVYLQQNVPDFDKNRINREVLPAICRQYDPHRPYIPSSPFSEHGEHPNSEKSGNVHLWKHGSAYRDDFYAKCRPNMVTEIGCISLPDMDVIKSFVPENKLWSVENEHWYLHCSDPRRSGESYRVASWFSTIANNGLPKPRNLDELIRYSQQSQTEATASWIEHFSSQPNCWGIFLWNLCDCWPQISDAYIAFGFHEKPALQAVQKGYSNIRR